MLTIGFLADYLEEGWPSMDLFAEMLPPAVADHSNTRCELLRPPYRHVVGRISGRPNVFKNADRLLNRMMLYPRWVKQRAGCFDLFHVLDHSYAHLVTVLPRERTVLHCHDLDTFRSVLEPQLEPRPRWFRHMAQRILAGFQRAGAVICISRTTRDAVVRSGLVPVERLTVIEPGIHPDFFAPPSTTAERELSRLLAGRVSASGYLLHVGSTLPRKGIETLLHVLSYLGRDTVLVRVGGRLTRTQLDLATTLGVTNSIITLPFVERAVLRVLYHNARLVLQPSIAEGFGLPVAEAMAAGAHVVASDIPVLREVGEDAVTYCATGNVRDWVNITRALLNAQHLHSDAWNNRLEQGMKRAQLFTWKRCAQQTLDLYNSVLERTGRAVTQDA